MASGSDLKFVNDYRVCPEDSDLNELLHQMDHCSSDAVYKCLIDTILDRYVSEHSEPWGVHVRNVLIEFFARTNSRRNLGKYMYEKLNSLTIDEKNLFECVVNSVTNEIQENINNLNIFRIRQCIRMLCFLSAFLQILSSDAKFHYFLEKVFPFYLCIMEVYTSQLSNSNFSKEGCEGKGILEDADCYKVLCLSLRQLGYTLLRISCDQSLKAYSVKMAILAHEILQCHKQMKFEAISDCSLVLAYFFALLPEEETEFLKYKQQPMLDFLDNPQNDYCVVLKSKKLRNLFVTDAMKAVLNMTVYNIFGHKRPLQFKIGQKPIVEFLYNNVVDLAAKVTSFVDQIIPLSHILVSMSKNVKDLEDFEEIFEKALAFAWSHLDHFSEKVVNNTKDFLKNVVQEAENRFQKKETQHLTKFFTGLNLRSVFSKVRLNALASVSQVLHCDYILINCPQVQNQLLILATSSAEHETAGHVYISMMTTHLKTGSDDAIINVWLSPVLRMLRHPQLKYHHVLEGIVIRAFQQRPTIYRKLFSPIRGGTERECVIMLKCLHYARINGITLPLDSGANWNEYWRNLILKAKLDLFMIHQNEEVRINCLQVIAECQKTTEVFTDWELNFLIKYFEYNVSTQLPSIRNKICTYFKKILGRFNNTKSYMVRRTVTLETFIKENSPTKPIVNGEIDDDEAVAKKAVLDEVKKELQAHRYVLDIYNTFFSHLMQLLVSYLSRDANYSRRSICLELLIFVHDFCCEIQWRRAFQKDDIANLKHLLNDSYESNKQLVVRLLKTLPAKSIGFDSEANTRDFYETSVKMACDIRPSRSVSASYMFQLILQSEFDFRTHEQGNLALTENKKCLMLLAMMQKLEVMFAQSSQNVAEAAKSTPLYGLLLGCRNLLRNRDIRESVEDYNFIFNKLATLCLAMKTHIMPVVCDSSPEGRIPSDSSEDNDDSFLESDQASRAQMILVYSWKTMKEIMLLLAELANETITLENVREMLAEEYLVKIGEFFVEIFIKTKHRGVFEQAHIAFTTVCRSFIHSKSQNLNSLPVKWLNQGVGLCTGTVTDSGLCPTRRSAGLPFLILSILPTLAENQRDHVHRAMEPLLQGAHCPGDDNRMHCLNVLRFLFKNAKLSEYLANYLDRGTIAALEGFRSRTYGVRNSAHLLLSALIYRIFGTPNKTAFEADADDTRMTLAVFYIRFKKLFEFLLKTLEEECDKQDSVILHPVLLILSRLYPSHNENINEQVKRHIPCINVCMRNPSYTTRNLAARASVSLISEYYLANQLNDNFVKISDHGIKDSECHGLLLQICHILITTDIDNLPLSDYLLKSMHLLSQPGQRFSHLTVTLYMDVVFTLLSRYRTYSDLEVLKQIVILLALNTREEKLTTCRTSYEYSHFQLLIFILLNKFQHVDSTYLIITKIILKALYGPDVEMKKKCLSLLIYLNEQFSTDNYKEHPLITSGDVEIASQIKILVHSLDFKSKKELLAYTHPYLISFFFAELKSETLIKEDYFILIFLLLRFYPCFFNSLHVARKQLILEWFLQMTTKVRNEEITSGVVSCLKTFIMTLDLEDKKHLNYSDLIRLLMESAAPSAADFRRLTVAQFLIGTQVLFKDRILAEYDRYNILNIVMVLLEDDETVVRNTMSMFPTKRNRVPTTPCLWSVVPYRARLTLLKTSMFDFRKDVAVGCLTSWALRRLPEVTRDASEVYERGEMNIYAENIPVTRCATAVLHSILWTVDSALSYENQTIFLEEQTLLVTTAVLNSLILLPSPMMDKQTKSTVICAFRSILKFVEDSVVGNNFINRFRAFFYSKILIFLRKSLDTDYSSTKAFLTYLYNPLLNAHFKFPQ